MFSCVINPSSGFVVTIHDFPHLIKNMTESTENRSMLQPRYYITSHYNTYRTVLLWIEYLCVHRTVTVLNVKRREKKACKSDDWEVESCLKSRWPVAGGWGLCEHTQIQLHLRFTLSRSNLYLHYFCLVFLLCLQCLCLNDFLAASTSLFFFYQLCSLSFHPCFNSLSLFPLPLWLASFRGRLLWLDSIYIK